MHQWHKMVQGLMQSCSRLEAVQVTERLTRLVQKHEGGIIVIEGEPGMGKTRLLEELEHESMGQRQSQELSLGQVTTPDGLPGLRKLCNVFVANGDLANKSKVGSRPERHHSLTDTPLCSTGSLTTFHARH